MKDLHHKSERAQARTLKQLVENDWPLERADRNHLARILTEWITHLEAVHKGNAKRYNDDGVRTTDCCGALSTYVEGDLVCKCCFEQVSIGEGDGAERREANR